MIVDDADNIIPKPVGPDGNEGQNVSLEPQTEIPQSQHHSLKHSLLGPSLTKAGQDDVDQRKVSEIIYEASKGSKFFNNEEVRDKNLTIKIDRILKQKAQLDKSDLKSDLRRADEYIASLEISRELSEYVVHIDCDAFYAAVEEIDRPELKNIPMAVGRGIVTTCNYEARKFGVRSAMAGFVAKKLCPQLVSIPLNFDKYTAKARELRTIFADYDPRFESASIDEAYLNITEYCKIHNIEPDAAMEQLRGEIREKCKVTVSAGIAPNAKLAKICSNRNKPNGQYRIPNDRTAVMSFISTLPVRKVNGIGRVLERELDAIGIKTCGDIYPQRAYLLKLFGEKAFQFLMQTSLGLGRTLIQPAEEYERKSVGTESTFRDISCKLELREKLRHTAEELEKDMTRVGVKGRTLVLKIKLHTYEVFTRQIAPPKAVHLAEDLYNYSLPMLTKLEKEIPDFRLRLMGLRCTHLVSTKKNKPDFFGRREANKSSAEGDEWEVWPDSEFEEAARQEQRQEFEELERLSQEQEAAQYHGVSSEVDAYTNASTAEWHEPFGIYKFGSERNSPAKPRVAEGDSSAPANEERDQHWDCPVCQHPQPANDKAFNDHIDLCLSRQTIKEAIAAADTDVHAEVSSMDSATASPDATATENRPVRARPAFGSAASSKATTITKRKPPANESLVDGNRDLGGRKQRKLFFT